MNFTLKIGTDNAAFHDNRCDESKRCVATGGTCQATAAAEIRRSLEQVCQHIECHTGTGGGRIRIYDANGNQIGTAGWKGAQ